MTSGRGEGVGQWLAAQSTAVQMFISGSAASISQQKKGRARACGKRLFKVIVACRATFAPSLSLSACALGRVGVPRPGQLVRLNNNFIAYTHTHSGAHLPTHTHTQTHQSHQLVLCVKIGNISFISFIPPRTNEVVKCKWSRVVAIVVALKVMFDVMSP